MRTDIPNELAAFVEKWPIFTRLCQQNTVNYNWLNSLETFPMTNCTFGFL